MREHCWGGNGAASHSKLNMLSIVEVDTLLADYPSNGFSLIIFPSVQALCICHRCMPVKDEQKIITWITELT